MTNIDHITKFYADHKGITFEDSSKIMTRELKRCAKRNGVTVKQLTTVINCAPLEKVKGFLDGSGPFLF